MKKGLFLVLEGIDGCGKTTQRARLAASLRAAGHDVYETAEPTESDAGKRLRAALGGKIAASAAELAALFTLDRIGHNREIAAALAAGKTVLCDRYYYSTLAYQGRLCDFGWVYHMNCKCPDIRHPDLCVFLDISPAAAMARIGARGGEREIFDREETLAAVREAFLASFEVIGDPVAIVDAGGTPDEVAARVWAAVLSAERKSTTK